VFPPRALCPQCGGREWRNEPVEDGVVEGATERDGTAIATIRTRLGPVLVARLLGDATAGDAVALEADGGVPVAKR